jgi:hypothetical protein
MAVAACLAFGVEKASHLKVQLKPLPGIPRVARVPRQPMLIVAPRPADRYGWAAF